MPSLCPVLWWDNTVLARIGGQTTAAKLPADGNDVAGFCGFVRGLKPMPKAIRVFYHSTALEHFVTPCPKGSRRTIQRALCHRAPALGDPSAAWAAHSIRAGGSGTTTLLYVEPKARVARLRAALAEDGVFLDAVFPILVLVEETAPPEDRGKPRIVLLSSDEAAAVYWITPAGDRHAVFFDGTTARERIVQELIDGFSIFKTAPVFTVINAGSSPFDLGQIARENFAQKPSHILSAAELLDAADGLSTREIYNFLPPASLVTFDHLCHVAALGLFFAGALMAGTYLSAIRSARANLTEQKAEERTLEGDIARLSANQASIGSAQAVLTEATVAPPVKLRFLETLNRARPVQISIQSATLGESTWTLSGHIHEGTGLEKGPLQGFLAALQNGEGWTVGADRPAPTAKDPDFTLSGTIP
jgi:hypothetical protein